MSGLQSFRARLFVSGCFAITAALLTANSAKADDQTETVVVTGEKLALEKAITDKLNSNIVSDDISSDEIGSIPEFGLGDALRKVPGVSLQINNGRGEDQFMTIRGLNPDYDTTMVDGMALASTEETTRWVSFDVVPSVIVNYAEVDKTWRVDQPTDAVGGVTDLHTRSAFDRPGEFFDAHLDGAYWEDTEVIHSQVPSGQADATYSRTFGPSDEFGVVISGSYFQRSSSTLNTYTLPWSYYPYGGSGTQSGIGALGQNGSASGSTLSPSSSLAGTVGIPDRHRWYFYDNDRTRPGLFSRFDFDDHSMFHAHIAGGFFQFINDENRHSQYLNRSGDPTITSPTTGSFAAGYAEVDYDKYVQDRFLEYVDVGGGVNFDSDMHLDLTLSYSIGHYSQTTDEDQFTYGSSSSPVANLAFGYDLDAPTAPLFTPNNLAAFMNPANYKQAYHLTALDTSTNHLPQAKLEFSDHFEPDLKGLGFKAGLFWRDLSQHYIYDQDELKPVGTAPTLAAIGTINTNVPLYDGEGQTLLLSDPAAAYSYVAANSANYARNSTDILSDTINNYRLQEIVEAGYVEGQYRIGDLYALLGVRYEITHQTIANYLPVPFSSTTNFELVNTSSNYSKLLPSLNLSYDLTDTLKLRGAVTETLARPEYAQLAENSSASINISGGTASETISNPQLKPRELDKLRSFGRMVLGPRRAGVRRAVQQADQERDRDPHDHHAECDGSGLCNTGGFDRDDIGKRGQCSNTGRRVECRGREIRLSPGFSGGLRRQRECGVHRLRLARHSHGWRGFPPSSPIAVFVQNGGECRAALWSWSV